MDHAMRCICRLIALGGHAIVASFLFSVVFFDAQAEESPAQTFQDALRLALVKDPRIAASIAAAEAEEARVTQARTAGRLQVTSIARHWLLHPASVYPELYPDRIPRALTRAVLLKAPPTDG